MDYSSIHYNDDHKFSTARTEIGRKGDNLVDILGLNTERHRLRQKYYKQCNSETPSPRLQFEIACLLSCSPKRSEIREALEMFHELLQIEYNQSECLYQLAMAHLKLNEYYMAKKRVEMLLRLEPRNLSALSLHSLIIDRTAYDGVGGAILFLGFSGLFLYLSRRWYTSGSLT